jgi:hypothetical protein
MPQPNFVVFYFASFSSLSSQLCSDLENKIFNTKEIINE